MVGLAPTERFPSTVYKTVRIAANGHRQNLTDKYTRILDSVNFFFYQYSFQNGSSSLMFYLFVSRSCLFASTTVVSICRKRIVSGTTTGYVFDSFRCQDVSFHCLKKWWGGLESNQDNLGFRRTYSPWDSDH